MLTIRMSFGVKNRANTEISAATEKNHRQDAQATPA